MGGGMSGLFPGTKGAEPQQMTLFNSQISMRRCNTTHVMVEVESSRPHSDGVGIGRSVQGRDKFLLTPYEVLRKCLHWRIGAITSNELVIWIHNRLNNKQYHMSPNQLRNILENYLAKLKSTAIDKKRFDEVKFLAYIEYLEKELESVL